MNVWYTRYPLCFCVYRGYCENTSLCRRVQLLDHFGEEAIVDGGTRFPISRNNKRKLIFTHTYTYIHIFTCINPKLIYIWAIFSGLIPIQEASGHDIATKFCNNMCMCMLILSIYCIYFFPHSYFTIDLIDLLLYIYLKKNIILSTWKKKN